MQFLRFEKVFQIQIIVHHDIYVLNFSIYKIASFIRRQIDFIKRIYRKKNEKPLELYCREQKKNKKQRNILNRPDY